MVRNGPYLFESVLDSLKTQKICEDAVEKKNKHLGTCLRQLHDPRNLGTRLREKTKLVSFVRERLQTHEMCAEALQKEPQLLQEISDNLKTQMVCAEAIEEDPQALHYVPYWFVTQEQVKILREDFDSDVVIQIQIRFRCTWCYGYKQRKVQKQK